MHLTRLVLQNFRSYQQQTFDFVKDTTLIVGPNTAGKTNLVESVYMLSFGRSFRAEKAVQMIGFNQEIARIQGLVLQSRFSPYATREGTKDQNIQLEVLLAQGEVTGGRFSKKFFITSPPRHFPLSQQYLKLYILLFRSFS